MRQTLDFLLQDWVGVESLTARPRFAAPRLAAGPDGECVQLPQATHDPRQGKLGAMRYFFDCILPKTGAWLGVVGSRCDTCRTMQEDLF